MNENNLIGKRVILLTLEPVSGLWFFYKEGIVEEETITMCKVAFKSFFLTRRKWYPKDGAGMKIQEFLPASE